MKQVQIPTSKSLSHRALIAAALADGISVVKDVLESDDPAQTRACLEAGGVAFSGRGAKIEVRGRPRGMRGGDRAPAILNVRESGTTCRLITAVAAAGSGLFEVRGEGRMHERPIGELARTLTGLGAEFTWLEKEGYPPFRLKAKGLSGGKTSISMEESSQYLSGLLLAAPLAREETVIEISGKKSVSWPYVALTLSTLSDFGIDFSVDELVDGKWVETDWRKVKSVTPGKVRFKVRPSTYQARRIAVEGDYSSASYFLAAGAVAGPVAVEGLRRDSAQGDTAMLEILEKMGAQVAWNEEGDAVTVSAKGGLTGIEVDMGLCPDLVPTVAVLATFAEGKTRIVNVAHLRIKESDRLAAMASEIERAGCRASVTEDSLTVDAGDGVRREYIEFKTYGDHRVAMSLALFELAGVTVKLDNPGCVAKSFPGFWDAWETLRSPV